MQSACLRSLVIVLLTNLCELRRVFYNLKTMCITSGPAKLSKTQIFACNVIARFGCGTGRVTRSGSVNKDYQLVIYSADVGIDATAAMRKGDPRAAVQEGARDAFILPVYNPNNDPDAIVPLDITNKDFFSTLNFLVKPKSKGASLGFKLGGGPKFLEVHTVGDASFTILPHKRDLARLNEVLLPISPVARQAVNAHSDSYSFIVYKMKLSAEKTNAVPPFGYLCPRYKHGLFVPTVHGHDGAFKNVDEFDHEFYFFYDAFEGKPLEAGEFPWPAEYVLDIAEGRRWIDQLNKLVKSSIGNDWKFRTVTLECDTHPNGLITAYREIHGTRANRNMCFLSKDAAFLCVNDLVIDQR